MSAALPDDPPRVGVGIVLIRDGQVLLGRRRGRDGAGTWGLPGGFLEKFESWEECGARELREECGLELEGASFVIATNDVQRDEDRHTITIFLESTRARGEPVVRAPDEVDRWEWFPWNALPEPRFVSFENLLRSGYQPRR